MADKATRVAHVFDDGLSPQERERERLRDEVVAKAKTWHGNDKGFTRIALHLAVGALNQHEAEHRGWS